VLETLNSLLSAGEAPGLYTTEELEPLLAPLRERMLEEGKCRYKPLAPTNNPGHLGAG
jgi:hypothetical protein